MDARAALASGWRSGLVLAVSLMSASACDVIRSDARLPDPSAPRVVPTTGPDAAFVATRAAPDATPPGIEGSVLFVRLTDPGGTLVLDRAFEWPSDVQAVPMGDYTLLAYWRGCSGNCNTLSPESPFCEHEVTVESGDRLVIEVRSGDDRSESDCRLETS